ncbi:WD40-repeat-containing domain protein [Suillus discolor]|uniref:WD40-repeat-containing domain protein n=1 Tax=Suillus discolor TaxID=1912936 RepID=A0A9P7ESB6_9AGAM|nr:WD40-repeat-containing domain protein [Suillus discolor]KAG2087458.1 WD40-repeat-containing domain protein [Suillus discolor]
MASTSTKATNTKPTLTPSMTLKGHDKWIRCISYFPDGQRMISGSPDKTARQWDLKLGTEIEEARDVSKKEVYAVSVSRDGRWVVTGDGDGDRGELKACEVETGIVKTFEGHSGRINCIDVSADNTLLASGSADFTTRIWNLETGKLVAGPFKNVDWVGAVRFSSDLKKLAVTSAVRTCIEVWDVQLQKLDVRVGKSPGVGITYAPVFWTNNDKNIITAFNFATFGYARTIYEFDALTLETVGTPFEGHTKLVTSIALSFDHARLASASFDNTIKLWDCESRQLLASFDVQNPFILVLSPDSHQLAYVTNAHTKDDYKIYICDIPPDDVLAHASTNAREKSPGSHLLNSDATRPTVGHRRPPIFTTAMSGRPPPTMNSKQPIFLRLHKLLRFSPRTRATRLDRKGRPSDPLDFPATSPLPPNSLHRDSSPSTLLPGGRAFFNPILSSSNKGKQKAHEPERKTAQVVDVPLGQATYADVFQKREKKVEPLPVYDDQLEDENVLDAVALPPPGVQHGEID